jgi:anti-sigma factor RsiW
MMNCDDFRRLKHDYADAELDQAATEELLAHAAGCAECAEGLHVLERLRGLLRGSAVEEPTEAALRRALQAVAAAADVEAAWVRSDPPAIMTLGELATYLRLSEREARRVAHQIPHFLVARHLRFRRQTVERWTEVQEQRAAAAAIGPVLTLVPDEGPAWALVG